MSSVLRKSSALHVLARAICVLLFSITLSGFARAEAIYTEFFSNKAVSGYDPVAFFTQQQAVKGKSEYRVEYLGVEWYFSSAKHKALFEENPDKYRPQYGGHCAWAVAANKAKAPGNVKYWRIVDDKLYLNYSKEVQEKWLQDIPGFIQAADNVWPELGKK